MGWFWSREAHSSGGASGHLGSRRHRKHSATGWTTNRTSEASAPLKTKAEPNGFFWTGRKKK